MGLNQQAFGVNLPWVPVILAPQVPLFFNGGTPQVAGNELVVAPTDQLDPVTHLAFTAQVYVAGLPYTNEGALVVDPDSAISGYVGGLPVTPYGVAVGFGIAVTRGDGGVPLTADGRIALEPLPGFSGFDDGFDNGFGA